MTIIPNKGTASLRAGLRHILKSETVAAQMHFPSGRTTLLLTQLDEAESNRIHGDRSGRYEQVTAQQHRNDNRWRDILTFDHSLLPGEYLNAALIPPLPGGSARRSYIASQAPLPHTLTAFYQHAIEQKVGLIVNLTPFEERGRTKADPYWPAKQGEVQRTGHNGDGFLIEQVSTPMQLDESLRATRYRVKITKAEEGPMTSEHLVSILHVKGWADFGDFPEDVFETLLDLIEREECVLSQPTDPIWVHCSAGVGRSGTVIASMLARDLGKSIPTVFKLATPETPAALMEASLRVTYELINHARDYRPRMVQTADQVAMVANVVARQLQ